MRAMAGNAKEVWAGALFLALGAAVLVYARAYPMGTATNMGPGYFPTLLAILLCVAGLVAVVQGLRAAERIRVGPLPLVPLAFVVAGMVGFAALVDDHGLAAAALVLIVMSCYGRLLRRPVEVVVLCVVLLAIAYAVFIYAIDLPLDFW
jgi:hypothetical protein